MKGLNTSVADRQCTLTSLFAGDTYYAPFIRYKLTTIVILYFFFVTSIKNIFSSDYTAMHIALWRLRNLRNF